ncbi:amidase [Mesorhizobium xinjiangense]|uniref:amidase n=1 Tax=Mesorhizobium xinjiangense TaxID=2678685 RepID=UPI0012EE55F0|nr:amidase [Mesorhizobium xinjiangense]
MAARSDLTTRDPLNAFLDYPDVPVPHADGGPLAGLTLGVKDIFDIAGYPTGCGNPAKLAVSEPARTTNAATRTLLDAGARFIGKTQTDEFAYSMIGMNAHFPPPVNSRAPERVSGGSSSGSAAAVAGGIVDIATGTDTNGSIRAPAAFCGLIGLRTTSGRIALDHTMPLAPSFDTFGWFARDIDLYATVGELLLGEDRHETPLSRPVRIRELEALLSGDAERAAYAAMLDPVLTVFDRPAPNLAFPGSPGELFENFKAIQGYEAWQAHGTFLSGQDRDLVPGVKERFQYARSLSSEAAERARARNLQFQEEFLASFGGDMVLVMPSQPSAAPLKSSSLGELESFRTRALTLTSIAGLLGCPQITIPLGSVDDAPFGISLLGPPNSDRALIALARQVLKAAKD